MNILIALITLPVCGLIIFAAIKLITRKRDFSQANSINSADELIEKLLDEIDKAVAQNKTKLVHKLNLSEHIFDGEIASNIAYRLALTTPRAITFNVEDNGDLEILIEGPELKG